MQKWNRLQHDVTQCIACPRLIAHCRHVALEKRKAYQDETYWGKPVPDFGNAPAKILIVGLAPGAHGANRTGRMFTGDRSGDWLYRSLFKSGLANQPTSSDTDDGLVLNNCVVTNMCRCAPPQNKPTTEEIKRCQPFFERTVELVQPQVLVALGGLAWKQILKYAIGRNWLSNPSPQPKFGHAESVEFVDGRWMIGSYHPSQQNTFTGRLTEPMLDDVFSRVQRRVSRPRKHR